MRSTSAGRVVSERESAGRPVQTVTRARERRRLLRIAGLATVLAGGLVIVDLLTIRDLPANVAAQAEEKEDDPTAPVTSLEGNPYLLPPTASAGDLATFLKAAPNKPAILQRREPFQQAVIDAAERLAAMEGASPEDKRLAIRTKFNALALKRESGDGAAGKKLLEWAAAHKDNADPAIKADATLVFLEEKLQAADLSKADALPGLLDEIRSFIASESNLDSRHLELASRTVSVINAIKDDPLAADAYIEFGKAFAKSKNRQLAEYGGKLQKLGDKMTFLIKPIELEGTFVDGTKLDWATYRGKVVLVDFWATWCGPCVAEMPHVKTMYEAYHDKGFEVIGISLDEGADEVKAFVAEHGIAWPMLHEAGGKHPMAEKYNVRAIPTMILVGKDGKVLNPAARGERLAAALKEIFGPLPEGVKLPGDNDPQPKQPGDDKSPDKPAGDKI